MERLTYTDKISGMSVPSKLKYDKNMNPILNEDFIKIVKKLAYYEELEESGRLIELPCSVGDTLYLLDHECSEGMKYNCEIDGIMEGYLCRNCGTYPCTLHPSIQQVEVKNITIMKENEMIIEFIDLRDVMVEDFGTKVFLTREEAEAQLKLKEMK